MPPHVCTHIYAYAPNILIHILHIHHYTYYRLDAGLGDTFYMWDVDRTCPWDLLLYAHRILLYMTGYTNYYYFKAHDQHTKANLLSKGIIRYVITGIIILLTTRSFSFLFWIFMQPNFCMSYFLALLNVSLHAFIEYDENGKPIQCINSLTIINGPDDYFGEDDHMAHHYHPSIFYKDLSAHQKQEKQIELYKKYNASVFQKISIVELSVFIVLNLWDKVAEHYVDYTEKLTKTEIITLLKTRAQRKEIDYNEYAPILNNPNREVLKELRLKITKQMANEVLSENRDRKNGHGHGDESDLIKSTPLTSSHNSDDEVSDGQRDSFGGADDSMATVDGDKKVL